MKKKIQLSTTLPPGLGEIELDERRMRQVLINLLTNAVKFTPAGGQVTLDVHTERSEYDLSERVSLRYQTPPHLNSNSQTDRVLLFSVIDTGIGIDPADQDKLFQPFMQIDSSLNRQYAGTGLGLTLVKQIVQLHGGSITLNSSLGQGSCFTVCLPYRRPLTPQTLTSGPGVADSYPLPAPALMPYPAPPDKIRVTLETESAVILLVEDNEANISTISSYLEARGYQILLARNGQEAIDQAHAHLPQIILMDIQMPGMDGLEAIQHLRNDRRFDAIPIIALTALAMPGDEQRCLAAGANQYLSKPVKLKHLADTIQYHLSSADPQSP